MAMSIRISTLRRICRDYWRKRTGKIILLSKIDLISLFYVNNHKARYEKLVLSQTEKWENVVCRIWKIVNLLVWTIF
jgi:hypothetical protein